MARIRANNTSSGGGLDTLDVTQFVIFQRNQSINGRTSQTFSGLTGKPRLIVATKLYSNTGVIIYNCENDTQFHWETSNNQQSFQTITSVTDTSITVKNDNSISVTCDIYVLY